MRWQWFWSDWISKHRMLLFIVLRFCGFLCHFCISKHRMLLFILPVNADCFINTAFQNIVCYCLSTSTIGIKPTTFISKHRMLLFISSISSIAMSISIISKHRMLLFIISRKAACRCAGSISKHRMLLFISKTALWSWNVMQFQNIVCYCLSFLFLLIHLGCSYFKTSYVTVYRYRGKSK